jgi:uncharacterized repeat protein (TIGR01451 family)
LFYTFFTLRLPQPLFMQPTLRYLLLVLAWTSLGRTVAWAQCNTAGTTVTLDYATRAANEDWRNRPQSGVPNVASFTQAGTTYTTSDNGSTLVTGTLNGPTLVWTTTQPNKNSTTNSTVTYNFSRAVSNVSVRVRDIDANFVPSGILGGTLTPSHGFNDQVTFTGLNGTTAVTPTLTKSNASSTFVSVAGNVATGSETAGNTDSPVDGTVTATYGSAITSLTIVYRNVTTATNLDLQSVGIDQISWCRITPTANNVTTGTVPSTAAQTPISALVGTADGTPAFFVTALPANGTLLYNSTGTTYAPVATTTALTAAQAASLRYTPNPGFTGTSTTFTYQTRDDAGLASPTATYTIPLQSVAACTTTAALLDFSTRPANEGWTAHAALSVPSTSTQTTISSGPYNTSPASTSTLQIGTVNAATSLAWTNQYTSTTPGTGTTPGAGRTSNITFTFNRPVSNFTVQVQDIDVNDAAAAVFIDQVVFSGSNGGTPVTPTLTAANPNGGSVSISGNTATGRNYNAINNVDGTVTAYFPSPITSLTLTYNNTTTGTNINTPQGIGIDNMTWCRLAPTANNVTTATVLSTATQAGIAALSGTADGTVASYTVATLPANGTLFYNSTGTTYAAVAAGQSLTAAQAASLRYTPNPGFAGTSTSFTYQAVDDAGVVSTAATYTIPLANPACATAAGTLNFGTSTPVPDDWRAHAAVPAPTGSAQTTVSSSGYTTPANAATSTLSVTGATATGNVNGVQSLAWFTDYANQTDNTSSVTFTFNRAVSNFQVRVQDIDRNEDGTNAFIDQVTFLGANGGTSVVPVLSPLNANTVLINGNVATGTTNITNNVDGTVVAYFSSPITSLTLTYRNISTATGNQGAGNPTGNAVGIDLLSFCRLAPVANNVTTTTVPSTATQAGIAALSGTADGTVASYTVATLPANGTLFYNSTGTTYAAVAAGQSLTAAQAASLRYTPNPGFAGTSTSFTYQAVDDAGVVSSNTATYTIPLTNTACATAAGTLNFGTTTPVPDDWRAHGAVPAPTGSAQTTVSSSGYTTPATAATSTLSVTGATATGNVNGVQSLAWFTDYANQTDNTSSVTFNFNRAVSNFQVRVQDIDRNEDGTNAFIDQVTFLGANGGTSVVPVLGPLTANNANTVLINGNVATGTTNIANTTDGTVVAYFSSPITSLTLTYRNISTATGNQGAGNPTGNAIGIDLLSFCRLAPVAANITNPSRPGGQGAAPINALSATADGTVASYTVTGLNPAQGTFALNGTALTNGQSLTPAQVAQLTFAPAAGFSGNAGFSYTATDDAGVASNTATYTVPVTATSVSGTPAPCATAGKDGSPTISANPNAYYPSTASQTLNVGGTSISVGPATGAATNITAGDLLLVIQMQGADINSTNTDSYGDGVAGGGASGNLTTNFTAGTYEYVVAANTVTAAAGGNITLASGLKNSYVNAAATATSGRRTFQVIRVPQYGSLTLGTDLTATPWNGASGGLIVLDVAGTLNMNGKTIDASGAGFRGGAGRILKGDATAGLSGTDYRQLATLNTSGQKGEGLAGTPRYVNNNGTLSDTGVEGYPNGSSGRGAPGNAGGGGTDTSPTDNFQNDGGGGGANGGRGGRGGDAWASGAASGGEPGAYFTATSTTRLVLGGGGGAGSTNDGSGTPGAGFASSGAAGGGLVMVRTGSVAGSGSILANGASANNTVANDASGGGGAGGSVLLTAVNTAGLANLTLSANGGTGGNNTGGGAAHGPGGGGGGGVILTNGTVAAATVAAGTNGTTAGTVAYGAAAGLGGVTNTSINPSIANSVSGASSTCAADVATTLSGPQSLNAGQPSGTFTATYTNYGPSVATNVTQQVTIPAGATNVLVNGAPYTPTGNVINFGTAATLASGATNTFTYSFTAPTTTGTVTQTSNVTTTSGEGANAYANAATFTSTIGAITDVSTTIAAASTSVATGQQGTFNVSFTNAGPSPATSPVLQVQLPAGLSGVTITGTTAGTTGSYNPTTGIVTYTYGAAGTALPSGTTITSAINFTVPTTGSVSAAAAISTATNELGRTANNSASATITATPSADVATVISGPASTVAGTMTTYSLVTTNSGPSTATNVAQTVQLPANLTNVFVSNGGTYNPNTGVVTFPSLGALVSGGVANNTISFMAPSSTISASASVSTATTDAVPANNSSSTSTSVTAPVANNPTANVYTTITTPSSNVTPGSSVAFTVVAGNAGPNAAASVAERVSLPTGLAGVTITDATGTAVSGASYSATTGVVTFPTIASLASGSTATYVVTATAPASGMLAATASIAATTNDLVMADNVATTDVSVNTPSDVATALTGPTTVGAGQAVTYTVATTNNGLVPAANVVQMVTIPAGLSSVLLSGSGTYDSTTGVVTFPAIASQAAGSSVVNTIQYTAPAATTLVNVATVTTASPDNVRTNNRSAVSTLVDPISDVTVAISGPTSIVQGNQVDYAVVTTNNGPSTAVNVATRVQLPPGLGTISLFSAPAGATYDNTTGIVTFPTLATQVPGANGSVTNIIRFIAPSGYSQFNATATVSEDATAEESNYANNTASIITAAAAPTAIRTDLSTDITAAPNPPTAGQAVRFTVTTANASSSTGTASGVVQRVALATGLNVTNITNGGTYDPVTGVVTFPAVALAAGVTQTNTFDVVAPGNTPLQVRALVTGEQSDPDLTNNTKFLSLPITPAADVATVVSGPTTVATGDAVTYSVLTINNGPSAAASVSQTVTIPANLPAGSVTITGGGTYNSATGVVTFPTIASELAGSGGQVMNTISFTAPSTTYTVAGTVSTTTPEPATPGAANNTSTVTVAPGNLAPVANAVVNALQTPQGNTAGPLLLSPLSATDANGNNTIASYRLTSIPDATTQGVLSLNGVALTATSVVTAAEAANLRFDPVAGFVGNAFFGYTATDNQGATSAAPVLYTIPVGQDVSSTYTAYNQGKGGANAYATGDVLAAVIDNNGARYTSTGAVYAANGTLLAGASNGLPTTGTNATLVAGTLPSGVSLDPATGRIFVSDASQLAITMTASSYTVTVQTTDVNGGTNTVPVTFTIGANPLPVVLTAFTAQAVQNRDALLNWATASEKSNDHFDVERSLDGTGWAKIGQVAGHGTTSQASSYTFTDAAVAAKATGPVYYRLHQVDLDGASTFSPVRSVSFSQSATPIALSLYPNPAQASTKLDLSQLPATGTYQVQLLDATGRTVRTATLAGGLPQPLDVQDLASGTYHVLVTGQLANGSAFKQTLRLTKE